MILTTCAACAAPLAHNAPRCVRCKLSYCNATCQHDHWRRGQDPTATLDDLREAVAALEEIEPTARRVFGGAHPNTKVTEHCLQNARVVLRARETPSAN